MRHVIFSLVLALLCGATVELCACATGRVTIGHHFSLPRLQRHRDALVATKGRTSLKGSARWIQEESLHPYLGFAPAPSGAGKAFGAWMTVPPTRGADRFTVAFVGGSFAQGFFDGGAPRLLARLAELPAYRGKTPTAVSLAFAGYKQPQQAIGVAYLLALGAEFDLVINIDGFNDVAIHPSENAPARVFPAFPRRWHHRMEGMPQGGALRLMFVRVQLEQKRAGLARAFSATPWRYLQTANVLYAVLDRSLERRVADTDRALVGREADGDTSAVAGPAQAFETEAEMQAHLVELWQRGSRLLDRLATTGQGRYYHFLQPNQYVPDAKPMGSAERARAIVPTHAYRHIVETAYPLLQKAGRALAADGLRFTDLTGVFAGHSEPLYVDACCHVSARGKEIVADAVFEAIRRDLQRAPIVR